MSLSDYFAIWLMAYLYVCDLSFDEKRNDEIFVFLL